MNLLCFLKHLLERRIARRREARRSDHLQRATPPRQPRRRSQTGANHPSQVVHGSMLCKLFGCGSNRHHGRAVAQSRDTHPPTPPPRAAADAHAIDDTRTNKNE